MGSQQKWADLRPLIEKGFELEGTPIAKLPPQEEKLWFPKRHMGKYAAAGGKSKLRRTSKVAMGSAASLPGKKKSSNNKKKSKSQEQ